ncbi:MULTISPECIES: hypothetical protein [Marivita]|uniref:Uncharacterized protein n=1 Tax=Marivita cryptomonadis TaxID=505252 RepID=A0A9Q2P8G3_9RHOB|nr:MULTISPECIES: hypothetical protein [Marivita]MCR9167826.1 hypothetical protein [Paracoccaceae bacterium]MBM2320250.1 hypothetical protein [Marivita cryptomonadis]MBM2329829.1 hypothetical protein [Marivita cryptomonadis]MBM2339417.1 hypothetical protein [Marivita cryptomonadis]MBM2344075.1 hypothetical protein [Marivita cryptomonadis]
MPNITPTYASLSGILGQQFTLGIGTPVVSNGSADCLEVSRQANVSTGGAVSVSESAGGSGVWVPYIPDRATYGFTVGGSGWMGTGPFSGCHIAFFTKGGRVGMAHIAKPSSSAETAWDTFRTAGGVMVLNEWKVPLPDMTRNSASYMFLNLSDPTSVGLTQVDVHVRGMGGSDGAIFAVKKLV